MLTNGFALFRGEGAGRRAVEAARRVERYSDGVVAWAGADEAFGEVGQARLSGRTEVAMAYALERGGFPLVHGFASGRGASLDGEFALLGRGRSGFFGARDPLGTRGLWVVKEGRWAGSMASDPRLLGGTGELLAPGSVYSNGEVRPSHSTVEVPAGLSFEEAAERLARLIDGSVKRRVEAKKRVAVSFSGGLDSSLIALLASKHTEVVLCSAYAAGSRDERQTARAAGLLGLELETAVLDEEAAGARAREASVLPREPTLMDEALWCIYSTTSRLASEREARTILLGQLADELFGGYMKYELKAREEGAPAAEEMMRADARACADWGFVRDEAACSARCEVRFPYADRGIASLAAGLPLEYKIRDGERKTVLRAAALELGLPEELAAAPKKAAQFSSGAAKLLQRR